MCLPQSSDFQDSIRRVTSCITTSTVHTCSCTIRNASKQIPIGSFVLISTNPSRPQNNQLYLRNSIATACRNTFYKNVPPNRSHAERFRRKTQVLSRANGGLNSSEESHHCPRSTTSSPGRFIFGALPCPALFCWPRHTLALAAPARLDRSTMPILHLVIALRFWDHLCMVRSYRSRKINIRIPGWKERENCCDVWLPGVFPKKIGRLEKASRTRFMQWPFSRMRGILSHAQFLLTFNDCLGVLCPISVCRAALF